MPGCLLLLLIIFLPRISLFFIWLLTDWLQKAYHTMIWPILGFLFMPYTTLAYMWAMLQTNNHINNGWLVLVIVAVFIDLSSHFKSARRL